jgi:hypothetical protein
MAGIAFRALRRLARLGPVLALVGFEAAAARAVRARPVPDARLGAGQPVAGGAPGSRDAPVRHRSRPRSVRLAGGAAAGALILGRVAEELARRRPSCRALS